MALPHDIAISSDKEAVYCLVFLMVHKIWSSDAWCVRVDNESVFMNLTRQYILAQPVLSNSVSTSPIVPKSNKSSWQSPNGHKLTARQFLSRCLYNLRKYSLIWLQSKCVASKYSAASITETLILGDSNEYDKWGPLPADLWNFMVRHSRRLLKTTVHLSTQRTVLTRHSSTVLCSRRCAKGLRLTESSQIGTQADLASSLTYFVKSSVWLIYKLLHCLLA